MRPFFICTIMGFYTKKMRIIWRKISFVNIQLLQSCFHTVYFSLHFMQGYSNSTPSELFFWSFYDNFDMFSISFTQSFLSNWYSFWLRSTSLDIDIKPVNYKCIWVATLKELNLNSTVWNSVLILVTKKQLWRSWIAEFVELIFGKYILPK